MKNNNSNNNAANNNSNNNEFNFGGIVMMNGTITTKEAFVGTVKTAMEALYSDGYTVRVINPFGRYFKADKKVIECIDEVFKNMED